MKSLRRSLNKDHHSHPIQISTPVAIPLSKPTTALMPPKKVIRALKAYRPNGPQELAFQKGDFFYVTREVEIDGKSWFEAHNPVTSSRGLVPKAMFEEFNKNTQNLRLSTPAGPTAIKPSLPIISTNGQPKPVPRNGPMSPRMQTYYAVVMHDFIAERPDELDAKAGESISVVAQSNREWFVAKPIGRLGGPGLIPVAFVQIRDPITGKTLEDVDVGRDLPRVEEWKKATLEYKARSIALGVLDEPSVVANSPFQPPAAQNPANPKPPPQETRPPEEPQPNLLPPGILRSAEVVSFHFENGDYWFRLHVLYRPDPSPEDPQPPSRQLVLFRVYDDFFDFQVALLDAFPTEAGRTTPNGTPRTSTDGEDPNRILPYMPGPVATVDDVVTSVRRAELDEYLKELCSLPSVGAEYVLRHELVREFVSPRTGDLQKDADEENETFEDSPTHNPVAVRHPQTQPPEEDEYVDDVLDGLGALRVKEHVPQHSIGGSRRSSDGQGAYAQTQSQRYSSDSRNGALGQKRTSADSYYDDEPVRGRAEQDQWSPGSQSQSSHPYSAGNNATSQQHRRARSSSRTSDRSPNTGSGYFSAGPSAYSATTPSSGYAPSPMSPTNGPSSSAPYTNSVHSGSSATATANLTNPPISNSVAQAAFIKMKIFHRTTDDLIAIRVSPRVTHQQLMEKVRERLGSSVSSLRYRDGYNNSSVGGISGSGGYVEIEDDEHLRQWIDQADKLILYAD